MASKFRIPFHLRLFAALLLFLGVFFVCFFLFQYRRERDFKVEMLHAHMQHLNRRLSEVLKTGDDPAEWLERENESYPEPFRITLIRPDGRVVFDSEESPELMDNHLSRPEVQSALRRGNGHTIRRLSASTSGDYFYSATRCDSLIIRSALPYDFTLREALRVDDHFLWFMLGIGAAAVCAGYLISRRLGENIARLRRFALRADNGEEPHDIGPFPHDDLGEISEHIVRLYTQLKHTKDALEQEHNLLLNQKEEQSRLKKQLTQNISHELKTPVSSIQGYLETILDNPNLTAEQRKDFLRKSYTQTERLAHLLRDISSLTRMDEAGRIIEKEPLDLRTVIDEVLEETAVQRNAKGIAVTERIEKTLPMSGNREMLHSIFRNLIDNATAYSGGDRIRIVLEEETDDEYTLLFADNGAGVGEEHLARLFERFYRIDKGRSRSMGGTGLGLAIVKNAVILHGGSIHASLPREGGLAFHFTLRKQS